MTILFQDMKQLTYCEFKNNNMITKENTI